ncbi:YdcF family protein [Nanoarchaeota archaeon]
MGEINTLLVLGGDNIIDRHDLAYDIYNDNKELNLVLSGATKRDNAIEDSEAYSMKQYLMNKGVLEEHIFLEPDSLDTMSNMVFSRPIVEDKLSADINKRFGIVTDQYHMDRTLYIAKKVFSSKFDIIPYTTEHAGNIIINAKEKFVKYSWKADLFLSKVKQGNLEQFEKYVTEKNPFFNDNAPFGFYKTGLAIFRMFGFGR